MGSESPCPVRLEAAGSMNTRASHHSVVQQTTLTLCVCNVRQHEYAADFLEPSRTRQLLGRHVEVPKHYPVHP